MSSSFDKERGLVDIAFVCGKTGGHIHPTISVAHALRKKLPKVRCFFLGTKMGLDKMILSKMGESFYGISGEPIVIKFHWKFIKSIFSLIRGFFEAWFILYKRKPSLVFGMGSYIAIPAVIAARMLRIPVLLYEPNVCMGRANRFLARFAKVVATGFPIAEVQTAHFNMQFTGHPIRSELLTSDKIVALKHFDLDPKKKTLLIVGGSQGAESINYMMIESMDLLKKQSSKMQVIHIVGERNYDTMMQSFQSKNGSYKIYPYMEDIHLALRAADILISRAGASIIAEAMFCRVPSIFIPYPYAMDDHQRSNAKYIADRHAGILLEEESLTIEQLAENIGQLMENQELREKIINACQSLNLHQGAPALVDLMMKTLRE